MKPDSHSSRGTPLSRRKFCAGTMAGLSGALIASAQTPPRPAPSHRADLLDLRRAPDLVRAFPEKGALRLAPTADSAWHDQGVTVRTRLLDGALHVSLHSPTTPLHRLQLRWRGSLPSNLRILPDHWERSYGDLEWRGLSANRTLPWYFLTFDGHVTHGYGVKVRPNAFCFWNVDETGISLWLDVRNGGSPVQLGDRELSLCTVTCRAGLEGETPFTAAREFCRQLCPDPLLPKGPILGTNDWYYSYGDSKPDEILRVTERVATLAPRLPHRMFSIIDGGWAPGGSDRGPWDRAKERFGDMTDFAAKLRNAGAEPGLWFRPLAAPLRAPAPLLSTREARFYDPSVPEMLQLVRDDVKRFRAWGYTLIKHDFSSFDIMGRWGFDFGSTLTKSGWSFADRSRTTAEIVLALYRALRDAAGDTLLIGCNTFGHLSAGLFEINRIGDDVSGKAWDRTRRMGVNTTAFRASHHRTFYAADPDIAAITREHPWAFGQQWLRLIAESGMPLFVSPDLREFGPEQRDAVKAAFATAAQTSHGAEPLDWLERTCPQRWKLSGGAVHDFQWMPPEGPWPFAD
jgi:alpha-galactosidase